MMKFFWYVLLWAILFVSACNDDNKLTKKNFPNGFVHHEYIVIGNDNKNIVAKGFKGAVPARSAITLTIDEKNHDIFADDDGRFYFETAKASQAKTIKIKVVANDKTEEKTYNIKNIIDDEIKYVGEPLDFNFDLASGTIIDKNTMLIVSGMASKAHKLVLPDELDAKSSFKSVSIIEKNNIPSIPQDIDGTENTALVLLSGSHKLALINTDEEKILYSTYLKDKDDKIFTFDLGQTISLASEIDNLLDGNLHKDFNKSAALSPNVVKHIDDNIFLVGFSNYYQFAMTGSGKKAALGKSVLALLKIKGEKIKTLDIFVANQKNPNQIFVEDKNNFWVLFSDAFEFEGTSFAPKEPYIASFTIDQDNKISQQKAIELKTYFASNIAFANGSFVIPSFATNDVLVLPAAGTKIEDGKVFSLDKNIYGSLKYTFAASLFDTQIFIGEQNIGLIPLDIEKGFFAFPFLKPIELIKDMGDNIPTAPFKMLTIDHDKVRFGVDYFGYQSFVFSGQNKIIPLSFINIFGP